MAGLSGSRVVALSVARKVGVLAPKMGVVKVVTMVHMWVANSVEKLEFEKVAKKELCLEDRLAELLERLTAEMKVELMDYWLAGWTVGHWVEMTAVQMVQQMAEQLELTLVDRLDE